MQITEARTNILIVDDDPDFLELLSGEIRQIPGVRVEEAHHPAEALKMLTRRNYQLVVSDWALDASNASEVFATADHLRAEAYFNSKLAKAKTPVMFISGSEKVFQTQLLRRLKHFEPVSFLVKSCGVSLIGLLAAHILNRFAPLPEMEPC